MQCHLKTYYCNNSQLWTKMQLPIPYLVICSLLTEYFSIRCWYLSTNYSKGRLLDTAIRGMQNHRMVVTTKLMVYVLSSALPVHQWMWWILSTPFRKENETMVVVNIYIPYIPWCLTKWPSTIYTEAVGYASHSLETISTAPFKTTFLVQLMLGKPRYKSKFKWIQAYSTSIGYYQS